MNLWQHQINEVEFSWYRSCRAIFWEPRCGKSRTIVESMRKVIAELGMTRFLIVGPGMALKMTWVEELRALPVHVVDLSSGVLDDRAQILKTMMKWPANEVTVVLVNYEALKPLEIPLLKWAPEGVVADEGHLIKSPSAQRTRTMIKLGAKAKWRRLLTGTPTPRSYSDLFAQYKYLEPSIFGTSMKRFQDTYCYLHPMWKSKVIGYKDLPELEQRAFSVASRVTRAQCFDMPEVQEIERRIELPDRARKAYDQMVEHEVLEMEGLPYVDATHKLARLVKLQKLTAGFISEGDSEPHWVSSAKIDAVLEELAEPLEAGQKVVISYIFRHEGAELEKRIGAVFGQQYVARLSGQTLQRDRERITAPFALGASQGPAGAVLIVQEAVGGLGISLAAADHMIFTTSSMDGAAHSQMRDRTWSPSKKMTYTYLRVPNSVDYFVKKVLSTKDSAQRALLDVGFGAAARGEWKMEQAA